MRCTTPDVPAVLDLAAHRTMTDQPRQRTHDSERVAPFSVLSRRRLRLDASGGTGAVVRLIEPAWFQVEPQRAIGAEARLDDALNPASERNQACTRP